MSDAGRTPNTDTGSPGGKSKYPKGPRVPCRLYLPREKRRIKQGYRRSIRHRPNRPSTSTFCTEPEQMIARAPSQSSMVAWPVTPKFCTTPITFLSSALPLSSTLRPWPSSVPVTSSIYCPEERLMFAASFTVAPASMVVGNSSAEATVTASLAFATRASPDCWHSAPFSAFCASATSHSFCRSAAASAPSWPTTGSAVIIELKTD